MWLKYFMRDHSWVISLILFSITFNSFALTSYYRCQKGIKVIDPEPSLEQRRCLSDLDCKEIHTVCQNCLIAVNDQSKKELLAKIDLVNGALSCPPHKNKLKVKSFCSKLKTCELR